MLISCNLFFHFLKEAYPLPSQSFQDDSILLPFKFILGPEDAGIDDGNIKMSELSKIGVRILPNRKIRFGSKTLQGVTLPKSASAQMSIMKRLLTRYGPCLEAQNTGYQINPDCFAKKENQFLKLLAKNLSNLRFKYIL